jgi:alanine racemase
MSHPRTSLGERRLFQSIRPLIRGNERTALMTPHSYYRCWVEVDLDALRHNVDAIRRRIPATTKLMAVVKADAYGHGLAQVAGVLMRCGVDAFAVANLTEALALRQVGGAGWPILLFGSALPFEIEKIIEQNITPTLSTLEEAQQFETAAAQAGRKIDVQVEIDTGMGRVGFWHEDALQQIVAIAALPHLNIEALYTHFPSADEDLAESKRELDGFLRVAAEIRQRVPGIRRLHAANSAALLNLRESALDLVRPGLLLYGITPGAGAGADEFRPVLSFKARVAFVKNVEAGRTISYGQTFVAKRPMKIATIAAGYADGFSRILSNKAEVLVGGVRCPVVGRVTMDQIMVDVTTVPGIGCGDEVAFIGRQGDAEINASEVARWEETIPWEVLCGITKTARVPRIFRGASAA